MKGATQRRLAVRLVGAVAIAFAAALALTWMLHERLTRRDIFRLLLALDVIAASSAFLRRSFPFRTAMPKFSRVSRRDAANSPFEFSASMRTAQLSKNIASSRFALRSSIAST